MRDFDAIFDQLPADAEAPRNLFCTLTREHQTTKRRERDQRRSAYGISSFFVGFVVVTREDPVDPESGVRPAILRFLHAIGS